ncbi:hypothetical protein SAMD00019534_004800, partial [Acytostelium subglobosum LB1]|uniref:hypothetical protein n=1 Tax=Acytostelium subglobosum LB1 TaxID=1410327 RepID=UPI0006451634
MKINNNIIITIIIYLSIYLFDYGLAASNQCTPLTCMELGETCALTGQTCRTGYYCNSALDMPTCFPTNAELEDCKTDPYCDNGLVCLTADTDQYCSNSGYLGANESCILPNECARGLSCVNGTCSRTPQDCMEYTCPAGKFCGSNKACVPYLKDGDSCTKSTLCMIGSFCSFTGTGTEGVCTAAFSKGEGESCNNDKSCDIGANLGCKNGVCTLYNPTADNQVFCLDDSACFNGIEECICTNVTNGEGKCQKMLEPGAICGQAYKDHQACLQSSGCPIHIQNPSSQTSCQMKACTKTLCKYQAACLRQEFSCAIVLPGDACQPNDASHVVSTKSMLPILLLSLIATINLI